MRPLVFLDTETTGCHRERRPWEIAMIRRDAAVQREITVYVDIADLDLDHACPDALAISRFHQRHPHFGAPLGTNELLCSGAQAAALVRQWTAAATVFGVVPSFDTECLSELLNRHGLSTSWHYQPWDIAVFASGYLAGRGQILETNSEKTSHACGVHPPTAAERHTAMGDARWVARWHDAIVPQVIPALRASGAAVPERSNGRAVPVHQ